MADVGHNCVEEVTVVPADSGRRNLGWNRFEGTRPLVRRPVPGYVPPTVAYPHTGDWCSVIGGLTYRGTALGAMRGWYLFTDYCAGRVLALSPSRHELVDLGIDAPQTVAFAERPDGEVYLVSQRLGVVALVPPGTTAAEPTRPPPGGTTVSGPRPGGQGDELDGGELFARHCGACHGRDASGGFGPPLAGGRSLERFPDAADQVDLVRRGRGAMPSFADRLSAAEIEAIVRYVRVR